MVTPNKYEKIGSGTWVKWPDGYEKTPLHPYDSYEKLACLICGADVTNHERTLYRHAEWHKRWNDVEVVKLKVSAVEHWLEVNYGFEPFREITASPGREDL